MLAALLAALLATATHAAGHGLRRPSDAGSPCRAPSLPGLTLHNAKLVAARSGCRLRVVSAPVLGERVTPPPPLGTRRVARQAPAAGGAAAVIDVWLVPECAQPLLPGPPPGEPIVRPGPTELVTGLYLAGGPFLVRPGRCPKRAPGAGTIIVRDATTGTPVDRVAVARGRLARIPLAPGTYTVSGVFAAATANGRGLRTSTARVTIRAGTTVRQDVVAAVP